MGTEICQNTLKRFAPSTAAASSTPMGTVWKKPMSIQIAYGIENER